VRKGDWEKKHKGQACQANPALCKQQFSLYHSKKRKAIGLHAGSQASKDPTAVTALGRHGGQPGHPFRKKIFVILVCLQFYLFSYCFPLLCFLSGVRLDMLYYFSCNRTQKSCQVVQHEMRLVPLCSCEFRGLDRQVLASPVAGECLPHSTRRDMCTPLSRFRFLASHFFVF
jgi:hypothetical protein